MSTWLPLVLAFLSFTVSVFVAGWTVYRDAVRKPRFRVSIRIKSVYQRGGKIGPDIWIEVLNLGPLPNRVGVPLGRSSFFARRFRGKNSFFIAYDHSHIGASAQGQMVDVGDSVAFVLPLDSDFVDGEFTRIGVSDGYGRIHWSKRREVKQFKEDVERVRKKQSSEEPD